MQAHLSSVLAGNVLACTLHSCRDLTTALLRGSNIAKLLQEKIDLSSPLALWAAMALLPAHLESDVIFSRFLTLLTASAANSPRLQDTVRFSVFCDKK